MAQSSAQENLIQRLIQEFICRTRDGDSVTPDEYARHYPDIADELVRALRSAVEAYHSGNITGEYSDVRAIPDLLADDARCPQRLGDFRILRQIGRGGMGVVYEAEQESLGRRVALKVLLGGPMLDARQLARFKREAQAAARLHHTNIVPVFGVGESDGLHYYVMQYIEGRGLEQVLADLQSQHAQGREPRITVTPRVPQYAGPQDVTAVDDQATPNILGATGRRLAPPTERVDITADNGLDDDKSVVRKSSASTALDLNGPQTDRAYWRNVARIGVQVADALAYAHLHGILHRDIKPANLLLDTSGTVWVTDFGLAKAAEQDNLTHTGDLVGTLRYMAPESFYGQIDGRTDIFALGLTLYELVALRPAYDAADRNNLVHQVSSGHVPPLAQLRPDAPRDLETIVLKALERDPRHRYQTADELAADLVRLLNDEPILARRISPVERFRRWCRRNPAVATLAMLLLVVFVAGFAGVTWKWREAEQQKAWLSEAKDELATERNAAIAARDDAELARKGADALRRRAERSEAEALKSAKRANVLNHFLVDDVLAAASPERAHGSKLTVEDVVRAAGEDVEKTLGSQPDAAAAVHNAIGMTLVRMGLYPEAETHLRRALELSQKWLGPESPETIEVMNNLALLLKDRGKLEEAEKLLRETLAARQQKLGPDNLDVLGTESNLAQLLQLQGKLAEAEKLAEKNLEHYRRVLGPKDPDTLLAQQNLALVLGKEGRSSQAEKLLREAVAGLSENKATGADHPYTLSAEHNLARLLQTRGELEEAEKLYRHVVETRKVVLGFMHPETLTAANQLATVLLDRGKLEESKPLIKQLLMYTSKGLGDGHPQTIMSRQNMARLLQIEGDPQAAEPLLRKNVEACLKIYGADRPDTLMAMGNLAVDLQAQGKLAEAEPLLRDVVKSQTANLGADHPYTLVSVNNLVVLLEAEGKLAEAEPLARKNLENCRRVLGPNHPDTLLAMSNIAQLMVAQGEWAEAEPLLRESLEARRRELGPSHPDTLNAMDDLVTVLTAAGKLSEAEQILKQELEIRRKVLGPEHSDTLKGLRTLAAVLDARGEYAQAEPLLRSLVDHNSSQSTIAGADSVGDTMALALNLEHRGEKVEAEKQLRDLIGRLQKQSPVPEAMLAEPLTALAEFLLREHRPAQAEPPARQAAQVSRKLYGDGSAHTALAENALGEALAQLHHYDEAEPLLLSSLGILQVHATANSSIGLQALRRVVELYRDWDRPKQAAEWQQRLTDAETPQQKPATEQPPAKNPPAEKPAGGSDEQ